MPYKKKGKIPEGWAEEKDRMIKELTGQIKDGVKDVFQSENYQNFLNIMSRFHEYSVRNMILIRLQRPDAQLVAGRYDWNHKFHRHIKAGSKALYVCAPLKGKKHHPDKEVSEDNKVSEDDELPELDEDETDKKENRREITRFTYKAVFDVSDTEGKPLPTLCDDLTGSVEGFQDFRYAARSFSPAPISFEKFPGGARGYFSPVENEIVIQASMEETQTLKTLIHEITHAVLHNETEKKKNRQNGAEKDRQTQEVEAESTAYTVCKYFGVDTSEYSFPYIATWSSSREVEELEASLGTIRNTAKEMIESFEQSLNRIRTEPSFTIYQISEKPEMEEYRRYHSFEGYDQTMRMGDFDFAKYDPVYKNVWSNEDSLDGIYQEFNLNHPKDYTGHSLSVGDIVVVKDKEDTKAWFVDRFGFKDVTELCKPKEILTETPEITEKEEKKKTAVRQPASAGRAR